MLTYLPVSLEVYVTLIKNTGKTRDELNKIVIAIDFLAYQFRFDSGEGIYDEVFEKPDFVSVISVDATAKTEE